MSQAEPPITAAEIRQRAYELWERNHRPDGLEIEFWVMAERELRAERQARLFRHAKVPQPPELRTTADDRRQSVHVRSGG